jgi:hypothetical protein
MWFIADFEAAVTCPPKTVPVAIGVPGRAISNKGTEGYKNIQIMIGIL